MSTKAVVRFMGEVDGDRALEAEVQSMSSAEQVVELARELGHSFTVDDLRDVGERVRRETAQEGELDAEQLETVAGGAMWGNAMWSNAMFSNAMWSNALFGNSILDNVVPGKDSPPSHGTVLYRKKDD
jgi:predicted ribosomally synthesized peptide with nif11-like leader